MAITYFRRFEAFFCDSRRQQISLLDLPDEIHLEILKHLDPASAFCLGHVSRRFYSLIHPLLGYHLTVADIKAGIRKRHGDKWCRWCRKRLPRAAFPHLIGSTPEKAMLTRGLKGWCEKVRQSRENRQRIGK